LWNVW